MVDSTVAAVPEGDHDGCNVEDVYTDLCAHTEEEKPVVDGGGGGGPISPTGIMSHVNTPTRFHPIGRGRFRRAFLRARRSVRSTRDVARRNVRRVSAGRSRYRFDDTPSASPTTTGADAINDNGERLEKRVEDRCRNESAVSTSGGVGVVVAKYSAVG